MVGQSNAFRQAGRYAVAGGAAVLTHLAVLVVLVEVFAVDKTLASGLGFLCAIPVNYLIQHSFVFAQSRGHGLFFTRYILVTLAAAVLNVLLFDWLVGLEIVSYPTAQLSVIAVIFVANFLVNRSFTFKSGK